MSSIDFFQADFLHCLVLIEDWVLAHDLNGARIVGVLYSIEYEAYAVCTGKVRFNAHDAVHEYGQAGFGC